MTEFQTSTISIRQEQAQDHTAVFELVKAAFAGKPYSNQGEHFLVERLRKSEAFIPELSLVAEAESGEIVGHILLTRVLIRSDTGHLFDSLSLAPVSVLPAFQAKGIGGRLIVHAHEAARGLGHGSVVLLGHADYYPRFGYRPTRDYSIELPFDSSPENCMAVELATGALNEVSGMVEYPRAFFEK